MAYTKTYTDCDAYFHPDNHVQAYNWRKYDDATRKAAFAQAKRELEVYCNRSLSDPASGDRYRDDYGHYEQSLWILMNTPRQAADGTSKAKTIPKGKTKGVLDLQGVSVSPMAQRYMSMNRIKMVRG